MSGISAALRKNEAAQGTRGALQIQTSTRKLRTSNGNASSAPPNASSSEAGDGPPRFDQALEAAKNAQAQDQNRAHADPEPPAAGRTEKKDKHAADKAKKNAGSDSTSTDDVDNSQTTDAQPDPSDTAAQEPLSQETSSTDAKAAAVKETESPDPNDPEIVKTPNAAAIASTPATAQIAAETATVIQVQPLPITPPATAGDSPADRIDTLPTATEKSQIPQEKSSEPTPEKPELQAGKQAPTKAKSTPQKNPEQPQPDAHDQPKNPADSANSIAEDPAPDASDPVTPRDAAPARPVHTKEWRPPEAKTASDVAPQHSPAKMESPLPPVAVPAASPTAEDPAKQIADTTHDVAPKSAASASETSVLNITTAAKNESLHGAESASSAQESARPDAADPMDQLVLGLKGKLDARTGKAEIRLDPPNLGAVRVSVSLEQGALTAEFQSSSDLVRDLLKGNLEKLKTVLQEQGVTVDRLAVSAPAADASAGRGPGQQPNFGSASHDGRSAGQYQQDARQGGTGLGQRRTGNDSFARVLRQTADAPIDLVA